MTDASASAFDVAVVGAGAAGIAAARRLIRAGAKVVVLEGRDRIGGRAYTRTVEGWALDVGCGWLHSADENPLAAMVENSVGPAGLTLDKTPPPWGDQVFNLGLDAGEQAAFRQAFDAFEDRVADAARAGDDAAASTLFKPAHSAEGRWNPRMDAISGALNGARFAEVSIRDYDAYRDTGVNWRVVEGYGTLVALLGRNAPIRCGCAVRRIDRSGPLLRLDTDQGVVQAGAAVVTVSSAVIASGALRIEPADEGLLSACEGVRLGLAAKLHMAVEGPDDFPPDSQLWGRTDSADTGGYHLRPFGRPLIEGYFGGSLAWGLEAEGEAAFFDFAVEEMVSLLGSGMRRRLRPLSTSMWGRDPFALGAYSHALPWRADDRARLRAPVEDRIWLAGEATAPDFYGTAHGAWMEGERAADAALAALGLGPAR